MKRNTKWAAMAMSVALVVVLTAAPFFAKQTQSSKDEVAFRAAMERETVRGDLKGAIEEYKKLAQSRDRALAARALVRMAESYQKLGDAEAQKVYQRIVREYADQKDALALAQARLGGSAVANTKGDRVVWRGPNVDNFGRVSSDGRYITYVDWNDGRLMLHDIASNIDRALTPAAPNFSQFAEWSAISRDGKQVVYDWLGEKAWEFRIATLQGSGFLEPRRLNAGYYSPMDWSPDGKWIAGVGGGPTALQIGLISVADGSFRSLKSVARNVFATKNNRTSIRFSPDGKHLAYDRPATDASAQRDVFVLAVDGSAEIPAVVHSANDTLMGWSPDGTRLLFSSDRTGSVGLWALSFVNGRVQGPPELLKSDIAESIPLGMSDSGTLYVYKRSNNTRDIAIAPLDLAAGKLLGPPVTLPEGFIAGARNAMWSPDGNYLSYPVPCNNGCIAIRSVATGQVRRVGPTLTSAQAPFWSPNGRSLLTHGVDRMGREGIFEIQVESGEATAAVLSDGLSVLADWSLDGKKVYFNRRGVLIERDLASGSEREIDRELGVRTGKLSPDGQYFTAARTDSSAKTSSVMLVSVAGNPPREILRLTQPEGLPLGGGGFTPDGRAVIITKDTGSRKELWLVPVMGGQPRKLDIDPTIWWDGSEGLGGQQGFNLSPDGRSIVFLMGRSVPEVWALENFLPAPSAKK